MNLDLVPAPDAAGVPGPIWLFQALLVFTFFLHLLFMNLTLGGTLLAWISHLRAGGRSDGPYGVLAGRMMAVNKFTISMAITTGVAPLLFIQVIYQQFFYSGTILLGWTWFGLIALVMAAYYAAYLYKFRGAPSRGKGGGVWLAVSAVGFLAVSTNGNASQLACGVCWPIRPSGRGGSISSWPESDSPPWSSPGGPPGRRRKGSTGRSTPPSQAAAGGGRCGPPLCRWWTGLC
jgi:hypothetical protein